MVNRMDYKENEIELDLGGDHCYCFCSALLLHNNLAFISSFQQLFFFLFFFFFFAKMKGKELCHRSLGQQHKGKIILLRNVLDDVEDIFL